MEDCQDAKKPKKWPVKKKHNKCPMCGQSQFVDGEVSKEAELGAYKAGHDSKQTEIMMLLRKVEELEAQLDLAKITISDKNEEMNLLQGGYDERTEDVANLAADLALSREAYAISRKELSAANSAYQRIFDEKAARCEYIAKLEGIVASLVRVEEAVAGGNKTFANQGQPMDGISALANFRGIAQDVIKEAEANGL